MVDKKIDKPFFILSLALIISGIFIFYSAALGFASRQNLEYSGLIFNQLIIGLCAGSLLAFIVFSIKYKFLKRIAPWIFVFSIISLFLVFIPGLGYGYNGAKRWIDIFGVSFQPIELVKISSIIFFSAWIAKFQKRNEKTRFGIFSLAVIIVIAAVPLILQPDFDGIIILAIPLIAILCTSKAPLKEIIIFGTIGVLLLGTVGLSIDHVRTRALSFININHDSRGANFQVQQALIAVGSGGFFGKGYGQSVQKFKYLPEPAGDSIFAVYSEEMGFVGAVVLILLYTAWALRGYKLAAVSKDNFAKYFIVGSVTLIITQSFINMASMLGILPVVGMPLVFISQGGTALMINLCIVGIILDMSTSIKA
ncbi:MAG: stage sporulation protein cell division protein FtsW [Candidatus Parcubacteria bacterium]|jgi:cell division protein FtsW